MRESDEIQAELDSAQQDLQCKVGQLKDLVESKLETPKRLIEGARDVLAVMIANKWRILAGAGVVLAIAVVRRRLVSKPT